MWLGVHSLPVALASPLDFGAGTVLVYQNVSGDEPSPFIIRVGRFRPDIVLEWESVSHQGTVHLYSRAVSKAPKLTVAGLFEPGIDHESDDIMTKWLPRELFDELAGGQQVKVTLNNIAAKLKLEGKGTASIVFNKEEIQVPVITIKDNRKGVWTVLDDGENPLLIRYETPYYHEELLRVATGQKNNLRWIKQLPPIK
jgi:hypothetical protein